MMPPLPEPDMTQQIVPRWASAVNIIDVERYSRSQMLDYGKLCRKQAMEEAAARCDSLNDADYETNGYACAGAIRDLI